MNRIGLTSLSKAIALQTRKRTVAFTLASLLAIGLTFATSEDPRLKQTQQSALELASSICATVLPDTSNREKSEISADGWRTLANWKKLTNDMSISDVQKILGEPEQKDGGTIGFWRYPNGGTITFLIGKVNTWREPQPSVAVNRAN